MDERSPRQPDSSGPPDDLSDGTKARQPRPENPYRIPERPPGSRPRDTGGFGFEHPRPADPVTPAEPEPESSGPSTEAWESPREASEDPLGSDGPGDRSGSGENAPWDPSEDHRSPSAPLDHEQDDRARFGEPEPTPTGWGLTPEPPAAQDSWGHTPGTDDRERWGAPVPETGGEDGAAGRRAPDEPSWERPAEDRWDTPGDGGDASWDRPAEPAHDQWSTPAATSQYEDRGTPAEDFGPTWNTGTGPSESERTQNTWDERPEPTWGAGANPSWGETNDPEPSSTHWSAHAPGEDRWDAPAEAGSAPAGSGPSSEDYWGAANSGAQGGWGQDPREPSSSESWQTPYGGQPTYGGDTPYPGSAPLRGDEDHRSQEEHRGEGYEYLYGGAGGHGTGGPGGPHGPHDEDPYGDDAYEPGPPPKKKSRRGLIIGLVATVVVLALVGGAAGWYVYTLPQPEEATSEYESAWEEQDFARLAAVTIGDDAEAILGGIDTGLGVDAVDVEIGTPVTDGGTGSADYEVTVSLTNADDWGWEGELPLVREDGEWWVDFSPEVAYPGLGEGQVLARTAVWGERGAIEAADGTRLDSPDASGSLQMIAGELGEADEDDVERLGPAYSVGDTVGKTGLQRTYEERLAGEAATTILMVDAAEAEDPTSLEATEENTVATLDGSDGESITTSFDMGVQNAAASAIIDADDPAGLVAIRPSTGEILAAVNVPGGFNRAFEGQYPPGSSFKIVTYSSLLDNGLSVDATMDCPEEYDLGGWPFRNAGGAEYGDQSVTEAFATSCNTALVHEIGEYLTPETLQSSAEQFGMNKAMDIGVSTHEPSFPAVDSSTMMGAQGIGQGQILTSPLHMATVPAAVADGSWRHPVLVTEPSQDDLPEPTAIGNAEALRPMMRAVITEGTAEDVDFDGEVFGKTGTAEFGTAEDADEDDELPSHAWMVGYKGDVAFALVVEGGGGGSAVAGPLAAKFTNGL
ncbi:penicillin-binding transpeptidase domain-containing protein [Nocardiopsis sp. MG754419]|uniref:penicillin-binding transpeptidase domain-containing protein n=1 Tax=Nocardiopsis sp. MG754419 TaxID=2259865 RepID=UPI001BA90642|nr:penicillin-binding transpeptidase domain-containing protein [Nocardiopsis sp. MG754419]MBR8740852.1 penicillin-binding protein [Nocardiopsis sp. MG754419]